MHHIQNLKEFLKNPPALAARLSNGARAVRIRLGYKPFAFIFEPQLVQEILTSRASKYPQSRVIFERIQPVTGKNGLVQLNGQESKAARFKSRSLFSPGSLTEMQRIVNDYTSQLVSQLRSEPHFDVSETMNQLILRTTLKFFLDLDAPDLTKDLGALFQRLNFLCGQRMRKIVPVPLFLPFSENLEIKRLRKKIREAISFHLEGRKSKSFEQLIDMFSKDPDLLDQCVTFVFAGHETTASSLSFALLLLAKNPFYQDIINEDPEMALLVYKESLRLYPPAYMLARQAAVDDELEGIKIRKSDQIVIALTSLHRNPKFFDRPDDFFPERFKEKTNHPFAFIPFGAGPKSCIGERLAYLEATTVLTILCKTFRFSTEQEVILADPLITLNARPGQFLKCDPR